VAVFQGSAVFGKNIPTAEFGMIYQQKLLAGT
jgi:hypothetical protein